MRERLDERLHMKSVNPLRKTLCGKGVELTTDPNLVTCNACLQIVLHKGKRDKKGKRLNNRKGKHLPMPEAEYKRILNER